ncbi:hypothetical protein RvY_13547 [Ramazzottius varieornatus]|uniref:L-Fucosyltransferase n=1 Tax=Ramazzottius varieornatus TaxID=947166 RepID=A0A1D1VNA4_RAMVA|nr:hypothetical protein RvY_13547 [Ramazzottius varieornatus]
MNWWRSLSWTRLPRKLSEAVASEGSKTGLFPPTTNKQHKLWLILIIPLSVLLIFQICRLIYQNPTLLPQSSTTTTRKVFQQNAQTLQTPKTEGRSLIHRLRWRVRNTFQRSFPPPTATQVSEGLLLHNMEQITCAGLGNFLFAVASVIGVARSTYRQPGLFQGMGTARQGLFPHLNFYAVPKAQSLTDDKLKNVIIDTGVAGIHNLDIYKQIMQSRKNDDGLVDFVIISGYMQSWRYLEAFHDEVRQRLQFAPSIYESAIQALVLNTPKYILKNSSRPDGQPYTLVGIHVRRGDMVNHGYGYQPASEAYLLACVSYFTRYYPNVLFVVASNDISYCPKLFQGSFVFIATVNPPEVDMALLTLMDHLILSVGTFGWWSAYLKDAIEIWFYKTWYKSGSGVENEYVSRDYFLPTWNVSDYKQLMLLRRWTTVGCLLTLFVCYTIVQ